MNLTIGNFEGDLVSETLNVMFRGKLRNAPYGRKLNLVLQFYTEKTLTRNFILRLPRKLLLMWGISFLVPGKSALTWNKFPSGL
jgi:hypothetical protein